MSELSPKLRIVFMGTPEFAVPVLKALVESGHDIVGVYTQPDRQSGRGKRVTPPPVKQAAIELGLLVFQPASLRRDKAARQELASLSPELIVVAAYGLYVPVESFELPRLQTLNVHPSMLPRYRGASPVASAILNGDLATGVTIMQLGEGMDAGPIVAQQETAIGPEETTEELTIRLFEMGAELLVKVLPQWEAGEIQPQPQDESRATETSRLSREDGEIDWNQSAGYIARQVRAYYPWPGTFTHWQGKMVKIIEASAVEAKGSGEAESGQVVSLPDGVGVVASEGILEVSKLQMEGKRAASVREFVQGYQDFVGSKLGSQ